MYELGMRNWSQCRPVAAVRLIRGVYHGSEAIACLLYFYASPAGVRKSVWILLPSLDDVASAHDTWAVTFTANTHTQSTLRVDKERYPNLKACL